MKIHILRLESSVKNGVASPEAGLIDLIYTFLLQEYDMDVYSYIHIHQIGEDLNEVIVKQRKEIYINIRYPVYEDFMQRSEKERNMIRLDVAHQALIRIAKHDKKLDISKLETIRERIIENDFNFEFTLREIENKKADNLIGKVIVAPCISDFKFYCELYKADKKQCRVLIYKGATVPLYFSDLFWKCKWIKANKFVITGDRSEIDIQVSSDDCKVEYINKSEFKDKAPIFEMFKANADREKTFKDYIESLNPAIAAIIVQSQN